jgi:hypothetical protein
MRWRSHHAVYLSFKVKDSHREKIHRENDLIARFGRTITDQRKVNVAEESFRSGKRE